MRISDWSSDVCSSDLRPVDILTVGRDEAERAVIIADPRGQRDRGVRNAVSGAEVQIDIVLVAERILLGRIGDHASDRHRRSEEHTSELQSLMRISYAVFCLKKKNTQQIPLSVKQRELIRYHQSVTSNSFTIIYHTITL